MKIALFVFRYGPSHGSILQTYALTRTLERMGHEVTIIDRQRPITAKKLLMTGLAVVKRIATLRLSFDGILLREYPKKIMAKLNGFIDKELRAQTITIHSEKELRILGKAEYDAYIVGSDQTWRPKYVFNIYNYYLDFVPNDRDVKRVAYAVSFGTSKWEYSEEQENRCKSLVNLFDGVSVREDEGIVLCKEHYNIDAKHVLDPTLLLKAEDYRKVTSLLPSKTAYVGYNFLDYSDEKMQIIDVVSRSLGLPGKQINNLTEIPGETMKGRVAPSIDEWISGIANADFVIADSFHATVFAILFHRPFIAVGNVKRGLSRFTSLLDIVNLSERLVTCENQVSQALIKSNINWTEVDDCISSMRRSSLSFLSSCLTK